MKFANTIFADAQCFHDLWLLNGWVLGAWVPTLTCFSLVPRPLPFFVLRFAFSIIHGSARARKTEKAWEHLSGHEVDVGGEGSALKYMNNILLHHRACPLLPGKTPDVHKITSTPLDQ